MTAILWLRRDLRVHDHPALTAALQRDQEVVPVFCFDERLLHGRHRSGPRTQFLLECLRDLDATLRRLGSALVVRIGAPERELAALAHELGAGAMHLSTDAGPFAHGRDARVREAMAAAGVELLAHPGLFVLDRPAAIRTSEDRPYTVFTPYFRAWLRASRRAVLPAPSSLPPLPHGLATPSIPNLRELGLRQEVAEPLPGGESTARRPLERLLPAVAANYQRRHDLPAADGTSQLSPYLHFGCVSARELEHRLPPGDGPQALRRQLCWRDFYAQVLFHHPGNAHAEYQPRYRGTIRWRPDHGGFAAWCEGRTGFPLVDAGMRQLRREGWMHNRVRLVVASFLTKDLGLDWRRGERWFMRMLIDGDEANNNGNWQWIASVGVDPQPPFRRIYNPARNQERFDPEGAYVRRYVRELASVPDRYLSEPWRMPASLQHESGCVIGRDYPEPIVDHRLARREALARYAEAG